MYLRSSQTVDQILFISAHIKASRKQETRAKVGQGELPRCLILQCCRYSSLKKLEDAFDTALHLM